MTSSVLHALAISVLLGVPLFVLAYVVSGGLQVPSSLPYMAWVWFAIAGVVHFAIGRYGNYRATQALGSNLSAPLQQISIPVSLALALFFLNETLTVLKFAGIMLVLTGPVLATWRRGGDNAGATPSGFEPAYREGILWGVIGGIAYGVSPLLIVKGLGSDSGLTDGIAGGLISYSAAAIVIVAAVSIAGGTSFLRQLDSSAGKWFLISAVLVFVSQMFRYIALVIAPVSVVVPIQRTSIVFRVVFSWVFNREHEVFGGGLLVGIAMSLIGAVALTLSTDIVQSMLSPEWARYLAREWP